MTNKEALKAVSEFLKELTGTGGSHKLSGKNQKTEVVERLDAMIKHMEQCRLVYLTDGMVEDLKFAATMMGSADKDKKAKITLANLCNYVHGDDGGAPNLSVVDNDILDTLDTALMSVYYRVAHANTDAGKKPWKSCAKKLAKIREGFKSGQFTNTLLLEAGQKFTGVSPVNLITSSMAKALQFARARLVYGLSVVSEPTTSHGDLKVMDGEAVKESKENYIDAIATIDGLLLGAHGFAVEAPTKPHDPTDKLHPALKDSPSLLNGLKAAYHIIGDTDFKWADKKYGEGEGEKKLSLAWGAMQELLGNEPGQPALPDKAPTLKLSPQLIDALEWVLAGSNDDLLKTKEEGGEYPAHEESQEIVQAWLEQVKDASGETALWQVFGLTKQQVDRAEKIMNLVADHLGSEGERADYAAVAHALTNMKTGQSEALVMIKDE